MEQNIFEDDHVLDDHVNKFFVIKKELQKEGKPPHHTNYRKYFKEMYNQDISEDTMVELFEFVESGDYAFWKESQIFEEAERGKFVDLRGIIEP